LDTARGGLALLARRLERAGIGVLRLAGGLPELSSLAESEFLGAVVHHRRRKAIPALRAYPALTNLPVVVWYPERTRAREFSGWWSTGAQDFHVGAADAEGLKARLLGLKRAERSRQPWMQEALHGLIRISRTMTLREDDFTVLATTAREMEGLFPGVQCAITMLSADGSAMVLTKGDQPDPVNIQINLQRYPEIEKVMTTRKPVAIKNVRRHPLMREVRDLIRTQDILSILVVPIFYLDEIIGLIVLRSSGRPRSFNRTEISFCEMVAHSTAVALRNLRLGREVAEEVKRSREAERLVRKKTSDLKRLETLFDHASDGIVMVDLHGRVRGMNVNFTRLSGFSREDLEGRQIEEFLHPGPDESLSIMRTLKSARTSPGRLTQVLRRKDGSLRHLAVRVERIPRRRDRLLSMHDITGERELEEALRRTKDFLENVIQSSMDAIIAADMSGAIILMNRAAEQVSGYRAGDVIGKMSVVDFYAPGVARDIGRKLRSEDYGGKGKLEACYNVLVDANGVEVPINLSAAIIYEDGREVASVGIFQDLRERIRIEKELRAAQERLSASQRQEALVALSGAAAHELNQPLTSILGYAELLRRVEKSLAEEMPDHPAVASLNNATVVIGQEAERMAEVVRKIGEVATFETRDYVGGRKIVDLDRSRGAPADGNLAVWQNLFQHMQEAVAVVGEDTMIRMANPAAVVLTGENLIGKSFTRYFKGIEHSKGMEAFERVMRGEAMEIDLEATLPTGENRLIHFNAVPVPERKEVIVIYADITESRLRERTLRGLSAFQTQLLKNSTLPLIALDVDGHVTFWNQAAEKMFGYRFDEVRGRVPDFLVETKVTPEVFKDYLRRLRHGDDLAGELEMVNRQGEPLRAYHVDAAMRDGEGLAIGYLTMIFDLSKQMAFERELKEKTERIAAMSDIADSIRSGVGLAEVLGGMLRKLARVFPLDLGAITIADNQTRDVMVISYAPASDQVYENTLRFNQDNGNVRKLLFMEQSAIFDDLSLVQDEHFAGDISRELGHMKGKGLRSLIVVPLIFRGEVLGALYALSKEPGRYRREDLDRVSQLAGPIAMALANARLFNQIQFQNLELSRRTAWIEDLIRAGQEVSLEMKVEEVIAHLVKPYFAAYSWQHLAVYKAGVGPKEGLKLMAALNYPAMDPHARLELDPTLLARLREKPEPVELDLDDPGAGFKPLLADAKTALLVPMAALDQWLGLIVLESQELHPFTENRKIELQVLGAYMAGVLRNLQFYADLDLALRFQRGLIENANALIFVLDRKGRVAIINRALQELLGLPAESVLGIDYRQLFDRHLHIEKPDDGSLVKPGDRKFQTRLSEVEQGESLVNVRLTILSAEGKESRCVFNTSSILGRDGSFQGLIAIGQNMTNYQELEKSLLQAEKLATIGQMAPGVAHELNNPLTGIISAANMLARCNLDERSRRLVDQLSEEARRIETLAHNLMSYARPSREEMFPLDLRAVVLDALSFSRYQFSRGQVEVDIHIPPGLPLVNGIKDQLQQVFINLLTNASHACAEKGSGHITIGAKKADRKSVEVRVADTGIGIPPENLPRLFDPFFTTKPEGKGTGLGLSIVKEIVARHRGSVRAESEPGKGAILIVRLPIYRRPA
jgi:PAS domain S-box-containing protein